MKITKKELKRIILQEYNQLASTQDDPVGAIGDFKTFAFETHINAIKGNLSQMDKIIRQDEGLDRKSLILFKETILEDLHMAVSHLEGAIEARLKKQNEDF
tara:strand:+ start:445 stop:747 length:303 start_codon:yes stop_codon:yes gene_type:complete